MENIELTDGESNLRQSWTLTFSAAEPTRNFIAVTIWAKASKNTKSLMQNGLFFMILNYWLWFMKKHKPQEMSFNFRQKPADRCDSWKTPERELKMFYSSFVQHLITISPADWLIFVQIHAFFIDFMFSDILSYDATTSNLYKSCWIT